MDERIAAQMQVFETELKALRCELDKAEVAAAYHEAGHAVVAMSLGFEVTSAYIDGKHAASGGHVHFSGTTREWHVGRFGHSATYAKQLFVVSCAGDIAQERAAPDSDFTGSDGDHEHQSEHISEVFEQTYKDHEDLPQPDANILFSALCNITRERVADNWLAIERVAEALLERKSLTGDEIRALYDGAAAKEAA